MISGIFVIVSKEQLVYRQRLKMEFLTCVCYYSVSNFVSDACSFLSLSFPT